MKIYTKTGDAGTTTLFGGTRVSKSSPQVNTYGMVDELSAFIGLLIAKIPSATDKRFLTHVQKNCYIIMSGLSGAPIKNSVLEDGVKELEKKIDEIELKLPKLARFILPQGGEVSALGHITRTICRRAEREVAEFSSQSSIIKYLNRLSDFLFVLARLYARNEVTTD